MLLGLVRGGGINIGEYLYSIVTGFWFLWAVWWATVICSLVEAVGRTFRSRIILHVLFLGVTFVTPDDLNFSMYKFMYAAFLVGYVAEKRNWDRKWADIALGRHSYLVGLAAVYVLLFFFFSREAYIYISGWTLLGRENWPVILAWDLYRTVIGTVGGAVLIWLIYQFVPEGRGHWLRDIGKNSSGIYILQTYANGVMMKISVGAEHHIGLNMIETVVICAGCYAAVKMISLIPWASLLLFGQKGKMEKK